MTNVLAVAVKLMASPRVAGNSAGKLLSVKTQQISDHHKERIWSCLWWFECIPAWLPSTLCL